MPGVRRVLRHGRAEHLVVRTVGLPAAVDVVAPTDAVLVQEVGDVCPRIVRGLAGRVAGPSRRRARSLHGRVAAHRDALASAARRPAGDEVEVLGQAPGRIGLEHVVLEHEVAGVIPVVGDLAPVVVSHDVRPLRQVGAARIVEVELAIVDAAAFGLPDEAVHLAAVDVGYGVAVSMRPTRIAGGCIEIGALTVVAPGVGDARHCAGMSGEAGDPVGSWIRGEVGVERPVLLHDDHDVPDLVDSGRRPVRQRPAHRRAGVVPAPR